MRETFIQRDTWQKRWEEPPSTVTCKRLGGLSAAIASAMYGDGFRLFHNGGIPLLERRFGDLRQEVLLVPAPGAERRPEFPFSVRIHLSHRGVQDVRARYWRPAVRAPLVVAAADAGALEVPEVYVIWHGAAGQTTVQEIVEQLHLHVIPWFEVFEEPQVLRERVMNGAMPLVDMSTAVELLLAEFGPSEARQFLRRWREGDFPVRRVPEIEGYGLTRDRVPTIAAYYRLA